MPERQVFIGTAGWAIPQGQREAFTAQGSQLQRYAAGMNCVEINSSFYRPHQPQTYARWAESTPAGFRFAVKLPEQISHEKRLKGAGPLLQAFASQAGELGAKWAVLLVQLPPSLALDDDTAGRFFEQAREAFSGAIVCEPRHLSWFTPEAERFLQDAQVCRAAVDPGKWPGSGEPGGWAGGVRYYRWHGSPRVYWSAYDDAWLEERARALPASGDCWCIFDNTAAGAALANARQLQQML